MTTRRFALATALAALALPAAAADARPVRGTVLSYAKRSHVLRAVTGRQVHRYRVTGGAPRGLHAGSRVRFDARRGVARRIHVLGRATTARFLAHVVHTRHGSVLRLADGGNLPVTVTVDGLPAGQTVVVTIHFTDGGLEVHISLPQPPAGSGEQPPAGGGDQPGGDDQSGDGGGDQSGDGGGDQSGDGGDQSGPPDASCPADPPVFDGTLDSVDSAAGTFTLSSGDEHRVYAFDDEHRLSTMVVGDEYVVLGHLSRDGRVADMVGVVAPDGVGGWFPHLTALDATVAGVDEQAETVTLTTADGDQQLHAPCWIRQSVSAGQAVRAIVAHHDGSDLLLVVQPQ